MAGAEAGALGLLERLRAPRPPGHRIAPVLEQIRAGLAGEAVLMGVDCAMLRTFSLCCRAYPCDILVL